MFFPLGFVGSLIAIGLFWAGITIVAVSLTTLVLVRACAVIDGRLSAQTRERDEGIPRVLREAEAIVRRAGVL